MNHEFIYCNLPFVDMRSEPKSFSKVVSQSFYSEPISVLKKEGKWEFISTSDGYTGWINEGSYCALKNRYEYDLETSSLFSHIYELKDVEYGPMMTLPFGSKLQLKEVIDDRWYEIELLDGKTAFIQRGDVEKEPFDLILFSKKFLNLPYTWGGRTSFGFDCSGFVQMIYRKMGIDLPRDAKDQILISKKIPLPCLKMGDLIFWGKSLNEISHVGLYLKKDLFIHTSSKGNRPYLRIDSLKDELWKEGGVIPFVQACRV